MGGHEAVVKLLLDKGANLELRVILAMLVVQNGLMLLLMFDAGILSPSAPRGVEVQYCTVENKFRWWIEKTLTNAECTLESCGRFCL
jgi:hypothetical protein